MYNNITYLYNEAVSLLQQLIATPSFSKEEDKTAGIIEAFFLKHKINSNRHLNNVWIVNENYNSLKPTLLLNSHHDTVKPNAGYTLDPFTPIIKDEKLYGLGSNDAGGSLVSLIATFLYFNKKENLAFNIVFAATAEEEISGVNGIASLLNVLPKIDCAIVGEPTLLQMAVAEKGLIVIDCEAIGEAGHAARNEGVNAIYKALKDIEWIQNFSFPKISETLGAVKMQTTIINAGTQHNVVPASCKFTIDVRVNDCYTNEEVVNILKENFQSEVTPRSLRLQSSYINETHPLVMAGKKSEIKTFGSPTLSDQVFMRFPSIKIGPGDSARSHSADEFIYLAEIKKGIETYINLICNLQF